jgi:TRAP-type uncharacterized transport system substrate-binding protein
MSGENSNQSSTNSVNSETSRFNEAKSRRNFIKAAGTASVIGLAGCSGNGDSGSSDGSDGSGESEVTTVTMTGSGTFSLGTAQALQRALEEESDSVELQVSDSGGNPASVQLYNQGETDSYSTENFTLVGAQNGQEPFDDPQDIAPQGFNNLVFHYYWMALNGSGIETTADILEQDVNVWMFPAAWGSRLLQEVLYQNMGEWENIRDKVVNLPSGDLARAIGEGRVDAFFGQGASYAGIPGWATEIEAREDVHVVETSDRLLNAVEETPSIEPEEIEPYGWSQDVGTDSVMAWNNGVQFCFGEDVPQEAVYEMARVSHEHPDVLQDAMSQYLDHSDAEDMKSFLLPDVPTHPGAAEFLKERDVWDESMTEADI